MNKQRFSKMRITIKLLTYKDYQRLFAVCEKTAKRMIAGDRKEIKIKRITQYHLHILYGVPLDVIEGQNKAKKGSERV